MSSCVCGGGNRCTGNTVYWLYYWVNTDLWQFTIHSPLLRLVDRFDQVPYSIQVKIVMKKEDLSENYSKELSQDGSSGEKYYAKGNL